VTGLGPASTARRIAVVGKGGVGKTALAAMLARVLMDGGGAGRLLAIDADPALGLAYALGMRVETTMGQVREAILDAARAGADREMAEIAATLDYMVMEALVEEGGLALLAMGRSDSLGCFCAVNDILREAIRILADRFDTILIDGEAGLEQLNRQVMGEVDRLVIVTDASARGLQTAALLVGMAREEQVIRCARVGLVFNRVLNGEEKLAQSAAALGVELLGFIPEDPTVSDYDQAGRSLLEIPAASDAVEAVRGIARTLTSAD
jgi:CO dehydrogenase maturation factor